LYADRLVVSANFAMAFLDTIRNLFFASELAAPERIIPAPPSIYSIRPLTKAHINELSKLNMRCFPGGEYYTKYTFNYLFNEPTSLSYGIVSDDGKMAGFIFTLLNSNGAAHITTIGVAPEHRRRGLANKMLRHLESALIAKGISSVMLEVRVSNLQAQKLYQKLGYTSVQRVSKYYSNGEDGYIMIKSLV
jgi:[ribosomal protein S18]-alanine N-acetyltransferase